MTSNEVRYQYDDMQQIARRFREQGDRAEALIRRVVYCLRLMDDGAWIGEGSQDFRDELQELVLPALRRLASAMGDAGWTMDRAADTMREAEEMGARLFNADGRPILVNFSSVGIVGSSFGTFGGFTDGEIGRFVGTFGSGRRTVDDLATATVIDSDEALDKRFGNHQFFNRAREILEKQAQRDIPPTLPGLFGPVVTPPWFTESSDQDGGLNGASEASVLVAGAGDHERLTGDIAKTSQALGGAQVSGVFAVQEEGPARGPGALAGENVAVTPISPAALALMEWVRKHPSGLFVIPPWGLAHSVEALNALEAEGFDLSRLNVVTFSSTAPDLPDAITHHRTIQGFPDLKV